MSIWVRSFMVILLINCTSAAQAQNRALLLDPEWIQEQVIEHGIDFVIRDYPATPGEPEERVHQALDLSRHVLRYHPEFTRRQLQARLVAYRDDAHLGAFQELPTDEGVQLRSIWPSFDQAGGPLVRMIDPIGLAIDKISITPDGERVAAGSTSTGEIHAVGTGQYLGSVMDQREGRSNSEWSFTSDCRFGVQITAEDWRGLDAECTVWHLQREEALREFPVGEVRDFATSGDGSRALTIGGYVSDGPRPMAVWNLESGEHEGEITVNGYIKSFHLSQDGRTALFIVACEEHTAIEVWDVDSRERRHLFTLPVEDSPLVTMLPDASRAYAQWGDAFRVYDLETGSVVGEWPHRREASISDWRDVGGICSTSDGQIIATRGSFGGDSIQVWDTEDFTLINEITGKPGPSAIDMADDGYTVVTESGATGGARINIWDMRRNDIALPQLPAGDSAAIAANGTVCALGSTDGTISICRCDTGEVQIRIPAHAETPTYLEFSRDGRRLVSQVAPSWRAEEPSELKFWDVETGELRHTLTPPAGMQLRGITDAGHVLCTKDDRQNGHYQWEVRDPLSGTRTTHSEIEVNPESHARIEVTPDGTRLVFASEVDEVSEVLVYDVASGTVECELKFVGSLNWWFSGMAVSNSTFLINVEKSIQVWDLQTGTLLQTLTGSEARAGNIGVTADGRYAVSLGRFDDQLRVWDVDSGECLLVQTLDDEGAYENVISIDDRCEHILVDVNGPRAHLFAVENLPPRIEEADCGSE